MFCCSSLEQVKICNNRKTAAAQLCNYTLENAEHILLILFKPKFVFISTAKSYLYESTAPELLVSVILLFLVGSFIYGTQWWSILCI